MKERFMMLEISRKMAKIVSKESFFFKIIGERLIKMKFRREKVLEIWRDFLFCFEELLCDRQFSNSFVRKSFHSKSLHVV